VHLVSSTLTPFVELKSNSLGPNVAGDIAYIDKITVWAVNPLYGLNASLNQASVSDSGLTDPVSVNEWGSATSLPGATFKVPTGHARAIDLHASTVLMTVNTLRTPPDQAYFVFQVSMWVSI